MTTTIYMIYCKDEEVKDFYIGSTKNYAHRKNGHIRGCYNEKSLIYNYYLYRFIRRNGGFDNWNFKILNQTDFHDRTMKFRQEQCYIDLMKPTLNDRPAFVSKEDRKKKRNEHNKIWCKENREYLNKKKREKRAIAKQSKAMV